MEKNALLSVAFLGESVELKIILEVGQIQNHVCLPLSFEREDSEGLQHSFGWGKSHILENKSLWGNTDQIRTCLLSTYCHDSRHL